MSNGLRDSAAKPLLLNQESSVEDQLVALGFGDVTGILALAPKTEKFDVPGFVVPKIEFLRSLGFNRPIRMIQLRPSVLFIDGDKLRAKMDFLKRLGFRNPARMIDTFPSLTAYNLETGLLPKIEALKNAGFTDPVKMMEAVPSIIGIDIASRVEPQLAALWMLGFANPALLIERRPNLLYIRVLEVIAPKIEFLRDMGFEDPMRMITIRPGLVALNAERNIAPTVSELQNWGYTLKQIEVRPSVISLSRERMVALREFLEGLNCKVDQLPPGLKRRLLTSLSFKDIQLAFAEKEIHSPHEKIAALANSENWDWIFKKATST